MTKKELLKRLEKFPNSAEIDIVPYGNHDYPIASGIGNVIPPISFLGCDGGKDEVAVGAVYGYDLTRLRNKSAKMKSKRRRIIRTTIKTKES